MARGRAHWTALRHAIFALLDADAPGAERDPGPRRPVPGAAGRRGDVPAGRRRRLHRLLRVGASTRPTSAACSAPTIRCCRTTSRCPSAITGARRRSSSAARRCAGRWGQTKPDGADAPVFGPCRRLDYELEVGVFIGPRQRPRRARSPIDAIEDHLFGLCLLNDWSARDIQAWEYQPLGPFLAKNFATTVSPWVVTMEALEPFRVPPVARPAGDPGAAAVPRRRRGPRARRLRRDARGVRSRRADARAAGCRRYRLSPSSLAATCTGRWARCPRTTRATAATCGPATCSASGTVSGPAKDAPRLPARADVARHGADHAARRRDAALPRGRRRGDLPRLVRTTGRRRIGFGECRGVVLPARPSPASPLTPRPSPGLASPCPSPPTSRRASAPRSAGRSSGSR